MIEAPAVESVSRACLPRLAQLLGPETRTPSEYRLANLFLYRGRHDYRLVDDGAGGAVTGVTYDGERHVLPFGPITTFRANRLLDEADCIYPLPEPEARALCASGRFVCDYRDADADYIYDAAAIATLAGAKVKRSQALAFARSGRVELADLVPNVDAARAVLDGWARDVGRTAADSDLAECGEALDMLDMLGLGGLLVTTGDVPVGFLIAGDLRNGERVVHFAKGRRAQAGVYPWMFARFAETAGAERLNFEQDLGNPGLAQSKQAFRPVERRQKYRVRKRG